MENLRLDASLGVTLPLTPHQGMPDGVQDNPAGVVADWFVNGSHAKPTDNGDVVIRVVWGKPGQGDLYVVWCRQYLYGLAVFSWKTRAQAMESAFRLMRDHNMSDIAVHLPVEVQS